MFAVLYVCMYLTSFHRNLNETLTHWHTHNCFYIKFFYTLQLKQIAIILSENCFYEKSTQNVIKHNGKFLTEYDFK